MTFLQVIETTVVLSLLVTFGEAIRRLYFHPIALIPGPKLAALTWWYEFYFDVVKHGTYVFKIQELHQQYGMPQETASSGRLTDLCAGPIIRITPDELHINDMGFLDTIYAPSSSRRDKYEYQLRTLRVQSSVGASPPHDVHKKRREALLPFFSKKNVLHLEPLVVQKVNQLCQLVSKHVADETPINLSDVFFALSNE